MNFVVIICDTLRRDHLGCYGNEWISTPHIDRFAEQSVVFLNAYSGSFPTVPHRRDLLTGRYTAAYTPWAALSQEEAVLPDLLRKRDYVSMMVCDTPHILENGYHYDRGFDAFEWIRGQESDRWRTWPETPEHPCDPAKIRAEQMLRRRHRRNTAWWRYESDTFVARTMTRACRWLEDNRSRDRFFLYVDTFDPHEPWDAPEWYVEMYDPLYEGEAVDYPLYARTGFLTRRELEHVRALYAAEVTLVDRWVGRLLQKLEDLGLLRDTMVVLSTDHGFLHGEHGVMGKSLIEGTQMSYVPLYEEICHIPLIVRAPDVAPGLRRAVVQPMDVMPTILDLAGAGVPEGVDGVSFADALVGDTDRARPFAVSSPFLASATACATVTRGRWSAVLRPLAEEEGAEAVDRAVDGFAKRTARREAEGDALYDLQNDPGQLDDIAASRPDIVEELREAAVALWRRAGAAPDVLARWEPEEPEEKEEGTEEARGTDNL
ncbi:MAG: sulfatase [Candidatus Brocadiia bacterium]